MTLASKIRDLDRFLTGKSKPVQDYPNCYDEIMRQQTFYFSDGRSRMYGYFNESDTWDYRLGSESMLAVKANWEKQEARLMVEAICTEINTIIQTEEKG